MKKIAVLVFISCLMLFAQGSHIAGGKIAFTYTGVPNQYSVQLTLYRDCSGIYLASADTICISSVHCNYSSHLIVNRDTIIEVNDCFNTINLGPTTCVGGNQFGIERHNYSGLLVLPFACDDWELVYSEGKSTPISTIGQLPTIIIKSQFDNLNFPVNSSPFFVGDPCFVACVSTSLCYSIAASDVDGDPLVYFEPIIDTSANGTCPQIYAPYSNLLYNISQYSQLDSTSGLFCFNVPYIMSSIVPYAVADKSGNLIKSRTCCYSFLNIANNNICTTGINEINDALKFTLSPNSANTYIQLSFSKPLVNSVIINVYDILGKRVKTQKAHDQTKIVLPVTELSAGVYLVEVTQGVIKHSARFVKQ